MRARWAAVIGLLIGTQSAAALPLEAIQERRYLIVAVKDNLYPLGFKGSDGKPAGFEIDLARELASALFGNPEAVRFVAVQNAERQSVLETQKADLVIANWSITVPRARAADFSYPYLSVRQNVLFKSPSAFGKLSDLNGRRIAVLDGSSGEQALRAFSPDTRFLPVQSYREGIAAVAAGQVEGFAGDNSVLSGWVSTHPGYRLLETNLDSSGLAIGMPRGLGSDSLRYWVNRQVDRLLKEGWLADRARRWGL